ncbi:hypothetical protein Paride_0387 [Pseudomonas phage Paride]|nr:hypothetical protein Paride_0387 [Pseudomonas phage Paride]
MYSSLQQDVLICFAVSCNSCYQVCVELMLLTWFLVHWFGCTVLELQRACPAQLFFD